MYNIKFENIKIIALIFMVVFLSAGFSWHLGDKKRNTYKNLVVSILPKARPIWERKLETSQKTKIGIITDTHLRATRINRLNKKDDAPRQLDEDDIFPLIRFNKNMAVFKPDFIVHLGDVIEGTGDSDFIGALTLREIKNNLDENKIPIWWVLGNHDLRGVSREEFKEITELESLDYVRDVGDYRFVFLDANYHPSREEFDFMGKEYVPGYLHPRTLV